MADGTYERRGPRESEIARFRRILGEIKASAEGAASGDGRVTEKKETEQKK